MSASPPATTRSSLRRASRWVMVLSAAYLGAVLLYALLRRVAGGSGGLGAALAYAPQVPWLGPCLALGLAALALRNRAAALANAAAAGVVLFSVMGFTWSLRLGRPPGHTIRVMTYNVAGGTRGTFRVLNDVLAEGPDLIALQEASPSRGAADPTEAILTALPGFTAVRAGDLSVISRYRIIASRTDPLPFRGARACLAVRVAAPGGPLTVITTHLSSVNLGSSDGSQLARVVTLNYLHHAQGRAVAALARAAPPPVVVLGDLNGPPGTPPARALGGFGVDAFSAGGRGFGYTFSSRHPLVRIDHVFAGPGLRVWRAWTPVTHGSDHRPVVAEIVVPGRGPSTGSGSPHAGGRGPSRAKSRGGS